MADILDTYTFDIDTELIDLSDKRLTKLPDLTRFTKLKTLICSYNALKELNNLPNTLIRLNCGRNNLLFTDIKRLRKLDNFIKFFKVHKLLKVIFLYSVMKRCAKYKEELIIKSCHPLRLSFI